MSIRDRPRLWYWQAVELLGIACRRTDIIISSALIGLLVAMTFTAAVRPVFSSRAKIHVDSVDVDGPITNGFPRPDTNSEWY